MTPHERQHQQTASRSYMQGNSDEQALSQLRSLDSLHESVVSFVSHNI